VCCAVGWLEGHLLLLQQYLHPPRFIRAVETRSRSRQQAHTTVPQPTQVFSNPCHVGWCDCGGAVLRLAASYWEPATFAACSICCVHLHAGTAAGTLQPSWSSSLPSICVVSEPCCRHHQVPLDSNTLSMTTSVVCVNLQAQQQAGSNPAGGPLFGSSPAPHDSLILENTRRHSPLDLFVLANLLTVCCILHACRHSSVHATTQQELCPWLRALSHEPLVPGNTPVFPRSLCLPTNLLVCYISCTCVQAQQQASSNPAGARPLALVVTSTQHATSLRRTSWQQ
jgi:hypothetical protein